MNMTNELIESGNQDLSDKPYTNRKGKEFLCKPGQAQRFPKGRVSQISIQSARKICEVVSPTHPPPRETFLKILCIRG
jgi:hypothetical protein